MKKFLCSVTLVFLSTLIYAQIKKPKIIIFPDDNWCNEKGYTAKRDNQGIETTEFLYEKALLENTDLANSIIRINALMAERGFRLASFSDELKSIKKKQASRSAISGASSTQTGYDAIMKTVKPDIIFYLGWKVEPSGFNKKLNIRIQAVDAYTLKQVAGAAPQGNPSSTADVPSLISEAILSSIDNFNAQLQDHFNDVVENGREISITVMKDDSWSGSLEKKYNYNGQNRELKNIIQDWVKNNTVKKRFNMTGASETEMTFEETRIPVYDKEGSPVDANWFSEQLQFFLEGQPFSIPVKVLQRGQGEFWVVLGVNN